MKFVQCVNYCHVLFFSTLHATTVLPMIFNQEAWDFVSDSLLLLSSPLGGFACLSHLVDTEGLLSIVRCKETLFAPS